MKPVIGNKSISIPAGAYAVVGTTDLSAVDNIIIPVDAAKVYGTEGGIVVEDDYDTVEVYTIDGMQVGVSGLRPGVYIVNVDGNVSKVLVR